MTCFICHESLNNKRIIKKDFSTDKFMNAVLQLKTPTIAFDNN